ncbi:TPA: hypothetical protein ACPWPG_001448 [Pseudomonas aeruginosa]|uniref:hypothetical protein n=1 Tax=Pseudomonas aeruginosa TaxID=287 RepID=UPI001911C268|nr:hypothetical protein [Pseudomonas aeruginosa]WCW86336.1 hypothetical protein KK204_11385 [Pseudomonas aeruginosa]
MSIILKGHVLNQRQLDAITPVMNDLIQGRVGQAGFEDACLKALENAGCPLGYDTTMPGAGSTIEQRATKWLRDGQVGASSRAIHDHMLGLTPKRGYYDHPHDPDDLNRCLLLLDLIPEWKPRMREMAQHSPEWAALASSWERLTDLFLSEAGLDWQRSSEAPETYAAMRLLRGDA